MPRSTILRVLVISSVLVICFGQRAEQLLAHNPCPSKTTCGECMRVAGCAWCKTTQPYNGPRCFNPAMENGLGGCPDEADVLTIDNQIFIDPNYNQDLSRGQAGMSIGSSSWEESQSSSGSVQGGTFGAAGAAGGGRLVQIQPQRVKMQLRMNQAQILDFKYAQAQDYPVDLYYLMDLSRSMKNDKEKLSTLGSLLSSTMKNITSNFRIGFGSFVDKVVMPYVSTVPRNLLSPCDGCAAPYGFQNQMSLSTDTRYFETAVAMANVSGNLDAPEGGFDAIMQAVVCKQVIGWREQARRLLVFSTDAGFHYAGDGKLGGIVTPNDGECHMENNQYKASSEQDYPSISQINLKVKQNAINIIFAVTAEQINIYEELSKHIEGSSSGVLSEDSSNVVDLVRDQYNKITSTVEMKDTSSDAIQVTYYSACLEGGEKKQTNICKGLKVGDIVEFSAEITLKECPKDSSKWKQTFTIYPVGVSESLTIEVEMLCDCPCEKPGNIGYIDLPNVCSGQGTQACGVCLCAPGRFGKNCECSASGGPEDLDRSCRPTNTTTGALCSNRGTCICGVCECNKMNDPSKVISGPFCECDNFSCEMNNRLLCSGPNNGECVCGKCVCKPEYTGAACQCLKDTSPCRPHGTEEICSGNGKCVCGECVCNVDDDRHYSGKYCESCPTCPGRCGEYKDCVLCEVHKQGPMYNPDAPLGKECGNCSMIPHHIIIEEGKIEANESRSEHLCSFYDEEDCLYVFVYSSYDENQKDVVIRAQKERECPRKVQILGIVLGVIAAIVLVGLALLMLWKMVTTIHDRREFARFEKERMMAKWDTGENPIYKQATSTFKNPTYSGK